MPRVPRRALRVVAALAAVVAGPLALFGLVEPQTRVGYATFRAGLLLAPSEAAFLGLYSDVLRETNGGYVPPDVDAFLASRWATGSPAEQDVAVGFYVTQPHDRMGSAHARLGEAALPPLVRRLDRAADPLERERCLMLLEGVRRGRALGKSWCTGDVPLADVEARYRAWLALDLPWPERARIEPLAGSGASWYEL